MDLRRQLGLSVDAGTVKTVAVSAAVVVVGVMVWKASRAAAAVAAGAGQLVDQAGAILRTDLNPVSQDNLVNRGVSAIGAAITGDPAFSLGGWLYDVTHADPLAFAAALPQAGYDETERLARRYPKPVELVEHYDPLGTYLGTW